MTDQVRNWQSVRTVIEGLTLAAILWAVRNQGNMQTQIAVLQEQIGYLTSQLSAVPTLTQQIGQLAQSNAMLQVKIDNNARRLDSLEQVKKLR